MPAVGARRDTALHDESVRRSNNIGASASTAASSFRQDAGGQQRVVQLVGVARIGPRLVAHAVDRGGVERAEVVAAADGSLARRE